MADTASLRWQPETQDDDFRRYWTTLRERKKWIVLAVILALVGAGVYLKAATPVYTAQAQVLVAPLTGTSANTLAGLGLISASSDPTQDVETAASLLPSLAAAQMTQSQLGLPGSAQSVLNRVSVQILSQSFVLAVTATASNPDSAARLANTFARNAIAVRSATFQRQLAAELVQLNAKLVNVPRSATTTALQQQIAALDQYLHAPVPDMSFSVAAVPPLGRTSPRASLTLGAALFVGLVVGILGAFLIATADPTVRREDELPGELSVLARVPVQRRSGNLRHRRSESLTPEAIEAYRTLRAMTLTAKSAHNPEVRSILVTSAAPQEGKTTTAINLAISLAATGSQTILIEADIRKPTIATTLGVTAQHTLSDVLTKRVELEQALVTSPNHPRNLELLLADGFGRRTSPNGDLLLLPTVRELLTRAGDLADYVVIDSPPLVTVIDALELAIEADAVLLVARLGESQTKRMEALQDLLSRAHVQPIGIALVGGQAPGGTDNYQPYYQATREQVTPPNQPANR